MAKNAVISGSLEFLGLADLIQLLGTNGSEGELRLTSKYAREPGSVTFKGGNPIGSNAGGKSGVDALYSLFGWLDAGFEFRQESITQEKEINLGRMEIILNGLRMLDDGQIEILGPVTAERSGGDEEEEDLFMPVIRGPIIDYMYVVDEENFYDGDTIVVEGKHGGWIWVILEGIVDVLKDTGKGPQKVIRLSDGSFIGTAAALTMGNPARSATIRAKDEVRLGVLDSQLLSSEFSSLSGEFKEILLSLDRRFKRATRTAAHARLGKYNTKVLKKFRKPLIQQGKDKDGFYRINSGEAYVVRSVESGYVPISKLYPGDYFGKIPFLNMGNEPFSASVFGASELKVAKVNLEKIEEQYEVLSSTLKNIIENTATCISATTMIACDGKKKRKVNKRKRS
jgi:CRP-like cAMP-binding protein